MGNTCTSVQVDEEILPDTSNDLTCNNGDGVQEMVRVEEQSLVYPKSGYNNLKNIMFSWKPHKRKRSQLVQVNLDSKL